MFLQVTLRKKGDSTHLETAECTIADIPKWLEKARNLFKELDHNILVELTPRTHIFEISEQNCQNLNETPDHNFEHEGVAFSLKHSPPTNPNIVDPALSAQFEGS